MPTSVSRRILIMLVAGLAAVALLIVAACGGDDDSAATATPDANGSPTPATPAPTPVATPSPTPGTPDFGATPTPPPLDDVDVIPVQEPFEVRAQSALNIRNHPSTTGALVGTLFPGNTARVIGEATGEMVEDGHDTWYQVELQTGGGVVRGFLYALYADPA